MQITCREGEPVGSTTNRAESQEIHDRIGVDDSSLFGWVMTHTIVIAG